MYAQQVIESDVLKSHNMTYPHTTHCLPTGEVMISTMGDADDNGQGSFATFDSKTFEYKGSTTQYTRRANTVTLTLYA